MDRELEGIVLAQWLNGKNLEDIELFNSDDFVEYRKLFKAIKIDGIDEPVTLCRKADIPVSDMTEIINIYSPALYNNAVSEHFQEKGKGWLQSNLDKPLDVIKENITKYIHQNVTVPEPTKDPVTNLLDELDRRAKEKPVLLGLSDLDYYMCGVRPSELTFIAARPSVGKSAFSFQCL